MNTLTWVGLESIEHIKVPQEWGSGQSGAVIEFRGCVRNINDAREVCGMHYDSHLELAKNSLHEIKQNIMQEYPALNEVLIYHRVGTLNLGECSLVVGVASPHRKEAFLACQKIIDEIKRLTPIWKREFYKDESQSWLPGTSLREIT